MNIKSKKGFTLIEILVVIAIISILSSVVLVSLNIARSRARDAERKSDIRSIITAMSLYYSNHDNYTTVSYSGTCGTRLDSSPESVVSLGLKADGIMKTMPTIPKELVGATCGDAYYVGSWNNGQAFAVLARLENVDSNCIPTFNDFWYYTGSYCTGYYVQVLPP